MGEESDDEEAQSLTRGKEEGDLSLVKLEKNVETNAIFEQEDDDGEENKRQWSLKKSFVVNMSSGVEISISSSWSNFYWWVTTLGMPGGGLKFG